MTGSAMLQDFTHNFCKNGACPINTILNMGRSIVLTSSTTRSMMEGVNSSETSISNRVTLCNISEHVFRRMVFYLIRVDSWSDAGCFGTNVRWTQSITVSVNSVYSTHLHKLFRRRFVLHTFTKLELCPCLHQTTRFALVSHGKQAFKHVLCPLLLLLLLKRRLTDL